MRIPDRWLAVPCAVFMILLLVVAGCRSPWVQCTIVNHQDAPVSLVEVNYPGGTFGVQTIAAGATYRYRFHSLGTDTVSIDFTDAAHHNHTVAGPELRLGQEGSLAIEIEPGNQVKWTPSLSVRP